MRLKMNIRAVCECGAEADATREDVILGDAARALGLAGPVVSKPQWPDGWTEGHALPTGEAVLADAQGRVRVDVFDPATKIATATNVPVPVLRCPACTAKNTEAGERARKLLDEMVASREVTP